MYDKDKETRIINAYNKLPSKNLAEIGRRFKLSRERVRQILVRSGTYTKHPNVSPYPYKSERFKLIYGYVMPKKLRQQVWDRDNKICVYCKGSSGDTRIGVDHVVPKSRGGSHDISNLVTCCNQCNSKKYNKTLTEWIRNEKVKISAVI